jgi:hypothetical protein
MPVYAYFDSKTNLFSDFWWLSIRGINDDPMVLTQGIFGLNLIFLLNHRGSSMNLGFESIHRVLTREFLSIINKTNIINIIEKIYI